MTKELNPKTHYYAFGGPLGAFAMIVILPVLELFLASCCDQTGYPSQELFADWRGFLQSRFTISHLMRLFDFGAFFIYCGFVGLLALFYKILPGEDVHGTLMRDKTRLKYRLNG